MMNSTAIRKAGFAAVLGLGLAGCSGMNETEQRTLSGIVIGAGIGAAGTIATGGCVRCGVIIGSTVGAVGGFIYDLVEKADGN